MLVTLVSPVHARDLDRFLLQRESIERCGIDLPHVAIVNDEDFPQFKDAPFQKNLTLVSTRDVLPRRMETRRKAWGLRRRNPRRWFAGKPMHGWGVQQLLKLAAPSVVSTEAYVCMDSDTLFVGKVVAEDFFSSDGKPFLYETFDDVDAEMAEWVGRSMRFLGVKATHMPVSRFTHSPVVMNQQVVLDMQRFIERRYSKHWMNAMDEFGMIMEYSTYGVFAKYVDQLKRVSVSTPTLSLYYWWLEQVQEMTKTFGTEVRASGAKIVGIQSNAGLDVGSYRHLLEAVWPAKTPQAEPACI